MTSLSRQDLVQLIHRVFRPRAGDRGLAVLVDLPDQTVADHPAWAVRRDMSREWQSLLHEAREELGLDRVDLVFYRNAHRNNADLPNEAWVHAGRDLPTRADELSGRGAPFEAIFTDYSILIAATEFSATAPLKLAARRYGYRAASMPGFNAAMIPALQLDYEEIHHRCVELKALLDESVAAHLELEAGGERHLLQLDLRYRSATASGGLLSEPGSAGNLPSGETYIVPYEGERPQEPSRSHGKLPLELEGELLGYRIEGNRIVEVIGRGPRAAAEREEVAAEPAYANVAELGLGVLADYGIRPVGQILLDEKLGLHVAFGRSDHFGGQVGAADFTAPDRVVHIDRVYIPEVQPGVRVARVELELPAGAGTRRHLLMRDGKYV